MKRGLLRAVFPFYHVSLRNQTQGLAKYVFYPLSQLSSPQFVYKLGFLSCHLCWPRTHYVKMTFNLPPSRLVPHTWSYKVVEAEPRDVGTLSKHSKKMSSHPSLIFLGTNFLIKMHIYNTYYMHMYTHTLYTTPS